MYRLLLALLLFSLTGTIKKEDTTAWIRINQLGYTPDGLKIAVWGSKEQLAVSSWQLVDAKTKSVVASGKTGKAFGAYGPFVQTYRLNFSSYKKPGRYYLQAGGAKSPEFEIGTDVYKGAADFCLRYMRQQRTGFNPFLKDSCHTRDGYVLYGQKAGIKDSTYIDVVGGWHDATDYLQYVTTSANATYHLLAAYRDFAHVFTDEKLANGLDGKNGIADVLDEAKWGLDWLLKMYPKPNWMFNQIADDRDHIGMRLPKEDTQYGRGNQRPVYFVSGEPQQRGKFMNSTTGTSSTAGKFSSAFALAHQIYESDSVFKKIARKDGYLGKALEAYIYGLEKPGYTQTASVKAPYIYAEENWQDDMELAASALSEALYQSREYPQQVMEYFDSGIEFAIGDAITPWLGKDTATHYQWYPFINLGHYELAKQAKRFQITRGVASETYAKIFQNRGDSVIGYYKTGIEKVWNKAKGNAFYRGVPFIWCSNNLTTAFAMQCYWYREVTGDTTFAELEQANFDWLFGCNPWGTSMVYGLPSWGDTPVDPHSSLTHLYNYPLDGGLVDGPIYTNTYKSLLGLQLANPDEYADFQSDLAVYHDDYGDYSTNEPTMDGTASLIYLLAAKEAETRPKKMVSFPNWNAWFQKHFTNSYGGMIRGDSTQKGVALVFTGDEFADGGDFIAKTLQQQKIKASFFFTGRFYRNNDFASIIKRLKKKDHYLGAHSDEHLLYCDWQKRDSLLVTEEQFKQDLLRNYEAMKKYGIQKFEARYFLPPYEWYNDSISAWTKDLGLQLINYTPGTKSTADYTTPDMKNYRGSEEIYNSIIQHEQSNNLNGFILLLHIGTDPKRTDKFYHRLPELTKYLKAKGYQFQTVNQLLN